MAETKQKKPMRLNIDGRFFVQDSPTFEQEMYIMSCAAKAGLTSIEGGIKLDDNKELNIRVQGMIIQAYESGAMFHLMSALLNEVDIEWTREEADKNAEFFRTLRSREAKKALQPALVAAILAFFESAADSDRISQTSLESLIEDVRPEDVEVRKKYTGDQIAAAFLSGSTTSRSKRLGTITRSAPKKSSNGKSGRAS